MWRDIHETRDSNLRERLGSSDRARGGRGGRSERDDQAFSDGDVFVRAVDLPLGDERELVRSRERTHAIDGSDSRLLATVGAFRVVTERDLEQSHARLASVRDHLRHLEAEGLLQRTQFGPRDRVVSLTAQGRELLETHRHERDTGHHTGRQAFYAGVRKPRELSHDSQAYRAYERAEARLRDAGGRVRRVVLDYELKREYQQFLQERNRARKDHDGRPDREPEEVRLWAREHELPYFDERVHFPDLRIEYDDVDGRSRHQDVEITTGHYRGAHAAATARCGFVRYRSQGGLVGGRGGGRRAAPRSPGLAEELL
jgi:DNA-binding MarR family transcriptional regulator